MSHRPAYRVDPYDTITARLKAQASARPLRQECSWCHVEIRPGAEPTSHGICGTCAKEYFNIVLGRE